MAERLGEATDTIKVGTRIANVYLRQSYTCAKSAAPIDRCRRRACRHECVQVPRGKS